MIDIRIKLFSTIIITIGIGITFISLIKISTISSFLLLIGWIGGLIFRSILK